MSEKDFTAISVRKVDEGLFDRLNARTPERGRSEFIRQAIREKLESDGTPSIDVDEKIKEINEEADKKAREEVRKEKHDEYLGPDHYTEKLNEIDDRLDELDEAIDQLKDDKESWTDSLAENYNLEEIEENVESYDDQLEQLKSEYDRLKGLKVSFQELLNEAKELEAKRKTLKQDYAQEMAEERLLRPLASELDAQVGSLADVLDRILTVDREFDMKRENAVRHGLLSKIRDETGLKFDVPPTKTARLARSNSLREILLN